MGRNKQTFRRGNVPKTTEEKGVEGTGKKKIARRDGMLQKRKLRKGSRKKNKKKIIDVGV